MLWITYPYPPLNCGVGRQVKIAKYLPDYGWQPVILSVKRSIMRPVYDKTLMKDVADEVYRTWSFESKLLMTYLPYLLHFNPKWVRIPDPFIGWLPFAIWKGLNILHSHNIDAIFSTSLHNTNHLIAYALKLRTGLPWLADFRDLWTQNTYANHPSLTLKIEQKLESLVLNKADRVTTINKPMMKALRAKYPDKTYDVISHGFDPQDFTDIKPVATSRFTITYTGSLYGKRKADTFLFAIRELIDEQKIPEDKLHIRFVGSVSPAQALSEHLNLIIQFIDTVTHEEVVSYLTSSDVLLLIQSMDSVDVMGTTGKLFEYIATGKPILALAPDSVASQIIRETNTGVSVSPNDKEGLKQAIHSMYVKWTYGALQIEPDKDAVARYDVRELAKRFAEVLDEILS